MPNEFSETVDKIVKNYLNRFNLRLKSFPEQDRDELVNEIHSHIYESFTNDPTENEVERIFNVLDKLGLEELPDDLDFITALTKRVIARGLKYREVPINYEERKGSSKLRIFNHGYRMIRNILVY